MSCEQPVNLKQPTPLKVVNFFGGPGCGKSTCAAKLYSELKQMGICAEMVTEYDQGHGLGAPRERARGSLYMFAKQAGRLRRLQGQVDVVITDAPLLMQLIFQRRLGAPQALLDLTRHEARQFDCWNYFLRRVKPFDQRGRVEDEATARSMDRDILQLLVDERVEFNVVDGDASLLKGVVGAVANWTYSGAPLVALGAAE